MNGKTMGSVSVSEARAFTGEDIAVDRLSPALRPLSAEEFPSPRDLRLRQHDDR